MNEANSGGQNHPTGQGACAVTVIRDTGWKASVAIVLHYVILIAAVFAPVAYGKTYVTYSKTFADHFLQWDGIWYSLIGKYGYHIPVYMQVYLAPMGNHVPIHPVKGTAFFPLIPLAVHVFGSVGALIFSNLLFVASVFLFAVWLKTHGLSVGWGVLLFALNPAAVFLSMLYPASYLVVSALCVMLLVEQKTKWWWVALVCGYLSALTAGLGIVIGVFTLAFWARREWLKGLMYAFAVVMGWITFALYLVHGGFHPLSFMAAEKVWGRGWALPLFAWVEAFWSKLAIAHWDQIYVAIFVVVLVVFVVKWNQTRHVEPVTFLWTMFFALFCLSTYWKPYPLVGTLRFIGGTFPLYGIVSLHSTTRMRWFGAGVLASFIFAYVVASVCVTHAIVYQ